jgi:hypothetical protein
MTGFERLQAWFVSQCDADWEHGYGISIETLDNPGWSVDITIEGTDLEDCEFEQLSRSLSENDWLHISTTPTTFRIRCSPQNLDGGLAIFCDWADSLTIEKQAG